MNVKYNILVKSALALALVSLFSGCAGPAPIEDYSLAKTALEAARSVEAPRFATGLWLQAQDRFEKSIQYYENRQYNRARESFKEARALAERAENLSSLERARRSGDGW